MTLSWNEIKARALKFSQEWAEASNEDADAKPFLVEFFNVFGITSRRVASFEHRVKKLDDSDGYIDLLWKGDNPCDFSSLYGFIKVLCALKGIEAANSRQTAAQFFFPVGPLY
jgi:hypothetical protein